MKLCLYGSYAIVCGTVELPFARRHPPRPARRRNLRSEPSADQLENWMSTITIRLAIERDGPALLRLAALDSARPLRGTVLLAQRDGCLLAARSLHDGATVADPFARTDHLRALLAVHAAASAEAEIRGARRAPDRVPHLRLPSLA